MRRPLSRVRPRPLHLFPGAEDEAAGLLDAFLARQVGGADEVTATPTAAPTAAHPAQTRP